MTNEKEKNKKLKGKCEEVHKRGTKNVGRQLPSLSLGPRFDRLRRNLSMAPPASRFKSFSSFARFSRLCKCRKPQPAKDLPHTSYNDLDYEHIPVIDHATRRLAAVDLDWKYFKSVDLYAALSTGLPEGGQILSVALYPTNIWYHRMKWEAEYGPVALALTENSDPVSELYELMDRISDYIAVAECDSSATADHIYKSLDGLTFKKSTIVLDLRFVPDCYEFEHEPHDIATEIPSNYEPPNFSLFTSRLTYLLKLLSDDDEPNLMVCADASLKKA